MAKQDSVPGKVQNQGNGKFKIDKGDQPNEVDVDIDLGGAGNYVVEKLKVNGANGLPKSMPDGTSIRWFNNFSIRENGNYIKKKYTVTIGDLQGRLGKGRLVIYSETHTPPLYYFDGPINGDSFDLDDGDPAAGAGP